MLRRAGLGRMLASPRLPWAATLLALILVSPALNLGFLLDDYFHLAALVQPAELPDLHRSPSELFAFYGEHLGGRWTLGDGVTPWWADPDLKLAFWRPLTGLTHLLDARLWPGSPRLMHLHSLFWFAAMVLFAGLFLRRVLTNSAVAWTGGLAVLLFAVDDAHGLPAMWIANRNALIAATFGFAALLAYDSGRRRLTPILLFLSVMGGEAGVACGAYLLAYALFLDRGPLRDRLLGIAPCAAVGVVWSAAYKMLGYGAHGSSVYVDPLGDPFGYVQAVVTRVPLLVTGQFFFPPADLNTLLSLSARTNLLIFASFATIALALLAVPLLRRDARARFFVTGMSLSLLPICATQPSNRLLVFVGLGAAGLLALWAEQASETDFKGMSRVGFQGVAVLLLLINLALSPFFLLRTEEQLSRLIQISDQAASTIEVREDGERLVFLSGPSIFLLGAFAERQALEGLPVPQGLALGTSLYEMEIFREDERVLRLRPRGGFLLPPGADPPGDQAAVISPAYALALFDTIFRDVDTSFQIGDRIRRGEVVFEVMELVPEGRPAEIAVTFPESSVLLEDWARYFIWRDNVYEETLLPRVGEAMKVEAPKLLLAD